MLSPVLSRNTQVRCQAIVLLQSARFLFVSYSQYTVHLYWSGYSMKNFSLPAESVVRVELSESFPVSVPYKTFEWMSVVWIVLTNQAFTSQCLGNQLRAHTVTVFHDGACGFCCYLPHLTSCIFWKRDTNYGRLAEIHYVEEFETRYGALNELLHLLNRAFTLMSKCACHKWMNSTWVQALLGPMHLALRTGPLCPVFCTKWKKPCSFRKVPVGPYT